MAWARISNTSHDDGAGTLAALVRERGGSGRVFAVTAAHVLGTHPDAALDDEIAIEWRQTGSMNRVTARLCAWRPHFDGSPADGIDAALSTINRADYTQLALVPGLLPAGVAQPVVGATVVLQSMRGPVSGKLLGYVSCWMRGGQSFEHRYFLEDALCYDLPEGSQHGDSGAAVWDAHGRLLAIHVGATPPGTQGNALGIPIQRVLDQWGVDLVSGSAAQPSPPHLQPSEPLLATTHRVVTSTGEAAPTTAAAQNGDDRGVLIRTVWGEARGEPREGMAGVAHVVLNRVRAQRYWGHTISGVCLKPYQFSCWNTDDPNRAQLLTLAVEDTRVQEVRDVVDAVMKNRLGDPTDGATHYHNRWMARPPRWAQGRAPCRFIGKHAFYKNID